MSRLKVTFALVAATFIASMGLLELAPRKAVAQAVSGSAGVFASGLTTSGDATINGNLTVTGTSLLTGNVTVGGGNILNANLVQGGGGQTVLLNGQQPNSATSIGVIANAGNGTISTYGSLIIDYRNANVHKSGIEGNGLFLPPVIPTASLPVCDATHFMGALVWDSTSASAKLCKGAGGWVAL